MNYSISDDKSRLDIDVIHSFLTQSYWAQGIPLELVVRSIENSLCVGVYLEQAQVGFARVVSDRATFAYLGDVFILEAHRGKGLSKRTLEFILQHPELAGLRRWILMTADAHELYKQFGFRVAVRPEDVMEIRIKDPYAPNNE